MRIVRLTPITYDMLKQLAEALEITEQEALTHAIVVAYCDHKVEENKEDN